MKSLTVVFDSSPTKPPARWVSLACKLAGFRLVESREISKQVSGDAQVRKLTLEQPKDFDQKIAPYYLGALQKLTAGKSRVAVPSAAWLRYGLKADLVIVTWDDLIDQTPRARAAGVDERNVEGLLEQAKAAVRAYLVGVPPDRLLEVTGADSEKAAAASAFILSKEKELAAKR